MQARVRYFLGFVLGVNLVLLLPDRWIVAPDPGQAAATEYWACPMLCVKLRRPGRCPVCDMQLERVADNSGQLLLSADQAQLIGVRTVKVERRVLENKIHVSGTIDYSDRRGSAFDSLALGQGEQRPFSLGFDAYDAELAWLAVGQPAAVRLDARPGEVFHGAVESIEVAPRPSTRATRVRVSVENHESKLTPGILARATVSATLGADGRAAAPSLAGRYTCRAHPDVRADAPGECPVCRLPLVIDSRGGASGGKGGPRVLVVPRDSVLGTGTRHLVYVAIRPNVFEAREIRIGPRAGSLIMVAGGLREGEVVAERGAFLMDSQMQLAGKPSLIVP